MSGTMIVIYNKISSKRKYSYHTFPGNKLHSANALKHKTHITYT